ncbi:Non-classical phosphatidylinositol transfer protein (PITP) [Tulasnella sp. 408]|nr:Non-classical phosphatidylinositol transfer protein (PITP) [Tulasnella sp. 408]
MSDDTKPTEVTSAPAPAPAPVEPDTAKHTALPEKTNPLVQNFTEGEKSAVKELVTRLPLIFEEAFKDLKDESHKLEAVDFWGVPIDPLKGDAEDARVDVILVKFIRARNSDIEAAQQQLIDTLKWRHTFRASDTVNEVFPDEIFGKLCHNYGKDKDGRPISYNVYGGDQDLKAIFGDLDRFLRWRISMQEKALRLLDFTTVDTLIQVHDYDGLGMSSRDANSKRAATEASKIFQDYYPETLHRKFFVGVPTIMTWIFWAFKPLVSAATFAKLSVAGRGPETIGKELLPYIDGSQLPKRYGGNAEAF